MAHPIHITMKKCFSHQTFSLGMCLTSTFTATRSLLMESFTLEMQPLTGSKAQSHLQLASDLYCLTAETSLCWIPTPTALRESSMGGRI